MKTRILLLVIQSCALSALAQGSVIFNNRVLATPDNMGGPQANVYAPIYGPEPGAPSIEKHGTPHGTPPAGGLTYGGPLLSGTGYTVQLWGGPGTEHNPDNLQLCTSGTGIASTTFRTGATTRGSLVTLADPAIVPNAPFGPGSRATLQLRVWDNQGGTIMTWAAAVAVWEVNPAGKSDLITPPFDLGGGGTQPPTLQGLTSFNIHTIPEPGSVALGLAGLAVFFLLRRR